MMRTILFAFLTSLMTLPLLPTFTAAQTKETIAAVVNRDIILTGEVNNRLKYNYANKEEDLDSLSSEEFQEEWDKTLDTMIDEQLIDQRIKNNLDQDQRDFIDQKVNEMVNNTMSELRKQYNSPEKIAQYEQQSGLSWEETRRYQRLLYYRYYLANYILPRFLPQDITSPTQEEIEEFTKENPNVQPSGKLTVAHILLKLPRGNVTQEEEQAVYQRARELTMRARSGESFEELVQEYSESPLTRDKKGLLPEFEKGDYYPEFDQLFELEEGEISDPIRTPVGYHVVKVINKNTIEDLVMQKKKHEAVQEWIKGLRENADIEIRKSAEQLFAASRPF